MAPDHRLLYHLALRRDWDSALEGGTYRVSTLGKSLDDVGFIHCSFAEQVQATADLFYRGREDVVVLMIDAAQLPDPVRVEKVGPGDQEFPHLYGPLPVAAVIRVTPAPPRVDRRLDVAAGLDDR